MKDFYAEIGKTCKAARKSAGYRQVDVAEDTGYVAGNISAFENGLNDNCMIFAWYIMRGLLTTEDIVKAWEKCI